MPITQNNNEKPYDLEQRTFQFAKAVALFVRTLPKSASNYEYGRQVVRSSGSVGSNYIEANEALGKKDFAMRIKICRKEAKESASWLKLIVETNEDGRRLHGLQLTEEAIELKKIFFSIVGKAT